MHITLVFLFSLYSITHGYHHTLTYEERETEKGGVNERNNTERERETEANDLKSFRQ